MKKTFLLTLMLALAAPALAAVPSSSSRVEYTGNDVTVAFTFTFVTYAASHVEVYVGGVEQASGFTVSLNANQTSSPGGTVTFTSAPGSGLTVRIQRTVPLTQDTVYTPYSAFPAKTTEKAIDRTVMAAQQLDRRVTDLEGVAGSASAAAASASTAQAAAVAAQASAAWEGSTSVMRPPYNAACNGVTDDTSAIQAALTDARTAGGGRVLIPASTVISSALVIGSNTWLEVAPNATVSFSAASGNMLKNYAAANTQRVVSDAAITSGGTTLTSATASFTAADVGRAVVVAGAGPGPGGSSAPTTGPLVANITVVTNATTVTLSVAAQTTVAGAAASIYTRDTNIRVTGGTWARGGATGVGTLTHSLLFRRVDGLHLADLTVTATAGAGHPYGIAPADVTDVVAERLTFNGTAAGIQFQGPASRLTVRDVAGTTTDDTVAFVARDYDTYADVLGNIDEVLLDGVSATSGQALVKVLGGTGTTVRGVYLRNLTGTGRYAVVSAIDDNTGASDIGGLVIDGVQGKITELTTGSELTLRPTAGRDVTIRNFTARTNATNRSVGLIRLGAWESAVIDGVNLGGAVTTTATTVIVNVALSGSTVGDLALSNMSVSGTGVVGVWVSAGATVTRLSISDARLIATDTTTSAMLRVVGSVDSYKLSRVSQVKGADLVILATGGVATTGQIDTSYVTQASRMMDINGVSTDLTLTNVRLTSLGAASIYITGSAALVIRGSGFSTSNTGISVGTFTGSVRVINPDYPLALDMTGLTKANGDTAYNTNGALSCGAGRVISDGTNWKNLFSGATY